MKIVALLTIRNEAPYIARCLEHLYSQGIETCLVDNGSTDRSLEIARSFLDRGVLRIEEAPFNGTFEWAKLLSQKELLAKEMNADWFIHVSADEILEAPAPYKTLREGIEATDALGYNAIRFDEFVFLPTSEDESYVGTDYVKEMQRYYYYRPNRLHRVSAWKKSQQINLVASSGYEADFEGRKISSEAFIMRHYMALSRAHALSKYLTRVYPPDEFERRYHKDRISIRPDQLRLPNKNDLRLLSGDTQQWVKRAPVKAHSFFGKGKVRFYTRRLKPSVRERFSRLFSNESSKVAPPAPFIVGVGRSGTTLLRLMLDSHPDMAIPDETYFITELKKLRAKGITRREKFFNILVKSFNWGTFHIEPKDLRAALKGVRPFTLLGGIRCFFTLYAKRFNKSRWGNKTPKYSFKIKFIQSMVPEAHFIHIIRDGRDTALSTKKTWWNTGDDIKKYAESWAWQIREARQQSKLCNNYIEIRYEDLLNNTTETLKSICEFIDLSYTEEMERYYERAGERMEEMSKETRHQNKLISKEKRVELHKLTKRPPDTSRISRWKTEMSDEDQRAFESIAGNMLRDLGYETPGG